jgi:hypothetical protein
MLLSCSKTAICIDSKQRKHVYAHVLSMKDSALQGINSTMILALQLSEVTFLWILDLHGWSIRSGPGAPPNILLEDSSRSRRKSWQSR